MSQSTREVVERYMNLLCEQRFADAFDLLADQATYCIIGNTAISGTLRGRAAVKNTLVSALASFRKPPLLKLKEVIAEGNRAVALASGEGVGPTGETYSQPHYAMVLRVGNGQIQDVVEFMDTVAVEVALLGRQLIPGR